MFFWNEYRLNALRRQYDYIFEIETQLKSFYIKKRWGQTE
jgi:hypothetical protein